jgi:hypothetical protein
LSNALAAVDQTHYLTAADGTNYLEIVQYIYNTEVICVQNAEYSEQKIVELYYAFIEDYDMLPELADIGDQVVFHNAATLEKIAQVMQRYDPTAIAMYERMTSQFVNGRFVYDENEAIEEILEQIQSDLTADMNYRDDDVERANIAEVLSRHNLPYLLDYNDDIYNVLKFLEQNGEMILVNDCQRTFFDAEYNAKWDQLYHDRKFYDHRYGRYSVVKVADRDHSGYRELDFTKGW